jgi:predicted enzyme related to lactoylglutathione lyase
MKGKTMSVHPANYVVWAEIPVSDLTASQAFYEALLQTRMNRCEMGGFDIVDFKPAKAATGVAGHLYVGTPAPRGTGPTVHLAIPGTVEAALDRCRAAGGQVTSPVIAIPPGRFAKIEDIDGNSIGIFEPAA